MTKMQLHILIYSGIFQEGSLQQATALSKITILAVGINQAEPCMCLAQR